HRLRPIGTTPLSCPPSFDSGSLVSRCSRRLLRGSNRGRRGDAGERGRYMREDGPKAVPKAAGEHVVIGTGSARGMGRRSRADDPEDVPEARGGQFSLATDIRGEGSVGGRWTG